MNVTTKSPPLRGTSETSSSCPVKLRKRIGSTTYKVAVHFSYKNKETMQDKALRMIEQEVSKNA